MYPALSLDATAPMHFSVALEYWYLDYFSTTGLFSNVDGKRVLFFAITTVLNVGTVVLLYP